MLSKNDFTQKQIIVIFSYELKNLSYQNENICIKENGKIVNQISLYKIFTIFLIGEATISTKLVQKLKSFGVSLVLLRRNLELIDVIGNDMNGNILLRDKQYHIFHDEREKLLLAKLCISNKILNQELLLT